MPYQRLADTVLIVHIGVVVFIVAGLAVAAFATDRTSRR